MIDDMYPDLANSLSERLARSVLQTARSGVVGYLDQIRADEKDVLKLINLVQAEVNQAQAKGLF